MIAFVRGPVAAWEDDELVVEVNGLGLALSVPASQLQPRPILGQEIQLYTHLQVREDAWTLFGFSDRDQLRLFRLLLSVSGVGAKTALAIVDAINTRRFSAVIAAQDLRPLTAVSGVGKKTAERVLLELKDKFPQVAAENCEESGLASDPLERVDGDLLAALRQLGYTATEARSFAIQAQAELGVEAGAEKLLRQALKIAMKS